MDALIIITGLLGIACITIFIMFLSNRATLKKKERQRLTMMLYSSKNKEEKSSSSLMEDVTNIQIEKHKKRNKSLFAAFISLSVLLVISSAVTSALAPPVVEQINTFIAEERYKEAEQLIVDELRTSSSEDKTELYSLYATLYLRQENYLEAVSILNEGLSKGADEEILKNIKLEIENNYKSEIAAALKAIEDNAKKQEEDKQKIIDDYKNSCSVYKYTEIARYPDKYKGKRAVFTGKVVQVIENITSVEIRINISKSSSGFWDDAIYVKIPRNAKPAERILEDDIISVYGELDGLITYKSILGQKISIPSMTAKYIEINKKEKEIGTT